ncbi:prolyl oligopeptidase family serine peptidase [Opitutus sp. GAS368]|uniref:prolyl oligopeptidase family serine peptidase n=1 Tax=Opitutus sp. GAS368 TaxID=1882749 RepID=UPI0018D40BA7|nr:prolyl oligopeptidase family serine peptidase [Opitutus sp. GAS368]
MAALAPVLALAAVSYPPSETVDHTDDYHGTKVADPYRWLEELDSPDTKAWVAAQNALTDSVVDAFPERAVIKQRLTELWNYPRTGLPFKEANWYFYTKNDGLQNQSPLYVTDGLRGAERLLLDPNTLSADGTVALALTSPSPDGKWLGYGLATGGSDWRELRLRDVATGQDAPDSIKWAKFTGMSWTHDGKGFFYSRYPAPADGNPKVFTKLENRQLYYHRVGTPQSEDRMVYAMPDQPAWFPGGAVSSDGRYLLISVSQPGKLGNSVYYLDLGDAQKPSFDGPVVKLIDQFVSGYNFLGNAGRTFYFSTDEGAPRNRIVALDLDHPAAPAVTVVPESADTMEGVRISAGKFVLTYMHDAVNRVVLCNLDGSAAGEIKLPGVGSVGAVSGKFKDPEIFISYSSYLAPGTTLRHDLASGMTEVFNETKMPLDLTQFEVKQVFYPSKDGTKIPMFLVYKKGLKLDGTAPTWLYGYGGFNITHKPAFAVPPLVWIERGGIYADACLRGGGEYGEDWHKAGTKERKQNVFDDYIAAADWLVVQHYTTHRKIVLDGRSNGGLLLGAVVNQRPDLAGAAVPAVGVMDMLRYHKFTVGAAWASDYGNSDTPEGFKYLAAYSPLHTVKAGARYPAVLVTTGDHDDRVFPAHSYKYVATMQQAVAADAGPVLIHIEANAGHGGSSGTSPVSKTIADWAYRMGFGAHFTGWGK